MLESEWEANMAGPRHGWQAAACLLRGHGRPARPAGTAAKDTGFTLIELLVVIIILGILIGVAIPIFLRQTNLAKETSAEAMLSGMGQIAYIGINQDLPAQGLVDEVAAGTRTGIAVDYSVGATSSAKNDVVALIPSGAVPGQWFGAVQPRPGRCTMVNVSDANGVIAARTVDSVNGQCRADLSSTIPLQASDFNNTITNPQTGLVAGNPSWNNGILSLGWGLLLNQSGTTSFNNGSLAARITLAADGNATGLAFRGSQSVDGKYTGYVYQIDRGLNKMVLWRWEDGVQKQIVSQIALPAGTNISGANDLQVDLSGNNFTTKLNGQTIESGALPINPATGQPYATGTAYGIRNSTAKTSTVSDLKLTPTG